MNRGRALSALRLLSVSGILAVSGVAASQERATSKPATVPVAPAPVNADVPAAPELDVANAGPSIDIGTVVARALRNNPTLQSAELDLQASQQNVRAEEGRYPYVLGADAGYTRSAAPRLGLSDNLITNTTRSYTVGTALRRTFPFGTTAEVRLQGQRIASDSNTLTGIRAGNSWALTGRASLTQPLLRGAGRRVGELELRVARNNRTASEKLRARTKSELVRDTIIAYWELWFADAAYHIDQTALALARRQEDQAKQQIAAGQLARADVLTFSTRVAELEQALVLSQVQKRQRSLELARLMGETAGYTTQLSAKSEPPPPEPFSSRAAVESALRTESIEIAELQATVRVARTRAELAGEASRPALDLDGYVETTGLSSDGVQRATERATQLRWTTAYVGLTFELPLDNRRLDALRASALLSVRIAEHNLKAARDRIAAEAGLAVTNEAAAARRIELAERTLEVAEKSFEAQRGRFELGEAIPIQVQEAEEQVRQARLSVARARIDLVQTQTDILHLSGQLLNRYDAPRSSG